jgi:hypothetical protein
MALLRLPLSFRPTPKAPIGGLNPAWLLPQGLASLAMVAGLALTLADRRGLPVHFLVFFVAAQVALQVVLILSWLRWRRRLRQPAHPLPALGSLLDGEPDPQA